MKSREQRIINVLLVICIALGFLAIVGIYIPDQLMRAKLSEEPPSSVALKNIDAISTIAFPTEELLRENSIIATFIPESAPHLPYLEEIPATPKPTAQETWSHALSPWSPGKSGEAPKQRERWLIPPDPLKDAVRFWSDIYARYTSDQVVLHDAQYLHIIYGIVDLSSIDSTSLGDLLQAKQREEIIDQGRDEVKTLLAKLAETPGHKLTGEELRISEAFQGIPEEDKFIRAVDRIRTQTGLKDKFRAGLKTAGKYLGEIESIFIAKGLPRELTRLIFVESMFQLNAESSAGAKGLWQFMRASGKHYGLAMNDLVDERLDPLRATHAAARHLQDNFDLLRSWPLAVNAYNAGRGRLKQAMQEMGTADISVIIEGFRHPSYGFASRNFFPEFLAAVDVVDNMYLHFPELTIDTPLRFDEILVHERVHLPRLAKAIEVDLQLIAELNPSLGKNLLSGTSPLPMGIKLRVPEHMGGKVLAVLHKATAEEELAISR